MFFLRSVALGAGIRSRHAFGPPRSNKLVCLIGLAEQRLALVKNNAVKVVQCINE